MVRCTSGPGPTPAPCAAPPAMRPAWPRSERRPTTTESASGASDGGPGRAPPGRGAWPSCNRSRRCACSTSWRDGGGRRRPAGGGGRSPRGRRAELPTGGDRAGRRPGRLGGLEQPRTERRLRRPAVATGRRLRHHLLRVRRRALPVRPRRARHPPARRGGGGPGGDPEPPRVGARLRRSGGGVVRRFPRPGSPRRGRSGSSSR